MTKITRRHSFDTADLPALRYNLPVLFLEPKYKYEIFDTIDITLQMIAIQYESRPRNKDFYVYAMEEIREMEEYRFATPDVWDMIDKAVVQFTIAFRRKVQYEAKNMAALSLSLNSLSSEDLEQILKPMIDLRYGITTLERNFPPHLEAIYNEISVLYIDQVVTLIKFIISIQTQRDFLGSVDQFSPNTLKYGQALMDSLINNHQIISADRLPSRLWKQIFEEAKKLNRNDLLVVEQAFANQIAKISAPAELNDPYAAAASHKRARFE